MKILLIGNFNEPQNHENFVKKGLIGLGHDVLTALEPSTSEHFDLGIVIRGEHQKPVESLRNACRKLVLWNWEPPGQPYLKTPDLDRYDVIFNSSKANNSWMEFRTKTKCVWLTQPIDPTVFKPVKLKKEIDVLYIGTCTAVRFNWINHLFMETGCKISIAGRGWGEGYRQYFLEELNWTLNRSKICLILPTWASPNYTGIDLMGEHYSLKNMMALATGVQLLMPTNHDFCELFEKDYLIWKYDNLEHMLMLVKEMLSKDLGVCELYKEVHEKYTYEKILHRLIEEAMK